MIKENIEQVSDNRAKSINKMQNNNIVNNYLKLTKPNSDKLSNMPKTKIKHTSNGISRVSQLAIQKEL